MRKMMSKEVVFTTLKLAKVEVVNTIPEVILLPDEVILGTISPEKAQKLVNKKHNAIVTITSHDVEAKVYEMPVEEFIKHAEVAVAKEEE